jgi:hypothetical protein
MTAISIARITVNNVEPEHAIRALSCKCENSGATHDAFLQNFHAFYASILHGDEPMRMLHKPPKPLHGEFRKA